MKLTTTVDSRPLRLTEHAVERYIERFRHIHDPTFGERNKFAYELCTLLREHGRISDSPPWNLYIPEEDTDIVRKTECYILVGDDICIPAEANGRRLVGVTVLAKGSISELRRARRNDRKQERRARRTARRLTESWRGERAQRWY